MWRDLIDERVLYIRALVLGGGHRLFVDALLTPLKLIDSVITSTGVIIAIHQGK